MARAVRMRISPPSAKRQSHRRRILNAGSVCRKSDACHALTNAFASGGLSSSSARERMCLYSIGNCALAAASEPRSRRPRYPIVHEYVEDLEVADEPAHRLAVVVGE